MDSMDPVRAFLNSVLESRIEIKRLRKKIAALESRATSITAQLSGMPRSGGADSQAVLAALADATRDYYARLAQAERRELEVVEFIESLPTQDSRVILKLRYVDRKRWSQVLAELKAAGKDIAEARMFRLHGAALNEARNKWKELHHDEERDFR